MEWKKIVADTAIQAWFKPFLGPGLIQITVSGRRGKRDLKKVKIRPAIVENQVIFHVEEQRENQAFHKNFSAEEAAAYLETLLIVDFKQAQVETETEKATALVNRMRILTGKVTKKSEKEMKNAGNPADDMSAEEAWRRSLSHNRQKNYILKEGVPVPFLIDLGVQTRDGKIVHAHYDKFRQINRFLEFIEDVLPELSKDRESVILDFGCGKSYLTFAMYYYLKLLKGYPVRIIGLDLKKQVIKNCAALAKKYGYDGLSFSTGDIASYEGVEHVDMVVTLHACDLATDYALEKAVRWGAKVILSVPCCQHELNKQIKSDLLSPVLGYGIIKERMAALFTDALRARMLEAVGYRVQILEFIDMEHTPKNLLIRAVYRGKAAGDREKLSRLMKELHVEPALYRLLLENGSGACDGDSKDC